MSTPLPLARETTAAGPPSWSHAAAVAGAIALVLALFVGPIGLWPWDHDEVHSLMELGRVPLDRYPGPVAQLERMHRLVPVWNAVQNAALSVLPANEWGSRLVPSLCGALVVILAFLAALRTRRSWFAWSVLAIVGGSQTLIWLAQQGRFYPLAMLWTTLALIVIWLPDRRRRLDAVAAIFGVAAVLSHNLALVPLAFGGAAAAGAWLAGRMPPVAARRAIVVAASVAGVYVLYLRPLLSGWISGGTGGTATIVSFVAQVGVVPIALAALGLAAVWREENRGFTWWAVLLVLDLLFVATAASTVGNWNPRYGVFFMPPIWIMAALGSATVAEALQSRRLSAAWMLALLLLLLPKFGSHFIDGSRHDFRTAAHVVAERAPREVVLSNWPATLQYYLEPITGQRAGYWSPGDALREPAALIVIASNAWEPVLRLPGYEVAVIGEVGRRRLDEQSHLVRIYRVSRKLQP